MDKIKFSSTSLSDELKRGVSDLGYDDVTLIQARSIPLILEGHDVIGRSQTGSGKTAAFGLPAIDMIEENRTLQVVILCPTRELALQATNELKKFAKYKSRINIVAIYGGEPIGLQIARLKRGCQIVVGTPGRLMDHMKRKTIKLDEVKMVVLDEADEMLNMGFVEDIETILSETPESRQTILFSATMPKSVLAIADKFQKNPEMVEIKEHQRTVSTIEQYYFNTPRGQKVAALIRLLMYYNPETSIIFCNTKKMVDELTAELKEFGFHALSLHGDMRQSARTLVMNQFKSGKLDILIATDVAARGIDVDDIKIVINYDLPMEDEYYVHRIGRTGRAGKVGKAFTLIQGGKQLSQLKNIMRYTNSEITQKPLPTVAELKARQIDEFCDRVLAYMEENDYNQYASVAEKIAGEKFSATEVAAALIAMNIKQNVPVEDFPSDFNEFNIKEEIRGRTKRVPIRGRQTGRNDKTKHRQRDENMASVRISIGKKDKVSSGHILGAVAGETGLSGKLFGAISIHDAHSTIEVPKQHRKLVVQKVNKSKIKGKTVSAV